eukprot:5445309-Amphidinium_carterae.1
MAGKMFRESKLSNFNDAYECRRIASKLKSPHTDATAHHAIKILIKWQCGVNCLYIQSLNSSQCLSSSASTHIRSITPMMATASRYNTLLKTC